MYADDIARASPVAQTFGETECDVGAFPKGRDRLALQVCVHLGDWNRCDVCFDEQVTRFFDQAGKFITAVAASAEPGARTLRKVVVADPNSCDAFPDRVGIEAQQRVFKLLVTGLPNKLIAYQIGVAEATVKAHVSAALRKLQVRSRAQAIALSSAFERNCAVGSEPGELIRRNSWATMPGSKDTAGRRCG